MPQAKITVNAVVGSNVTLPINTLVQLDNQNSGGELSFAWSIIDQPPGPVDALSSVSAQNPFFTPKKEGTYLLRLIVNQGLPTEQEDRVVAAVQQLKTLERIPAAGETTEADTLDGWATAMNSLLRRMDTLLGDPGLFIGVNASGGTLNRGDILRATASSVIKSGLPGQETVPGMSKALATTLAQVDEPLVVCEGTISGGGSVVNGALMKFRILGRFAGNTGGGAAAVGDSIYVTDTGAMSITPGTTKRKVGSAMTAGATYDVWFAGIGGEDITPIDRAYLVYGNPGTLTNAFRVDGPTNASSVSGAVPFTIKTADNTTITAVLRRFSSSGLAIQQWQSEAGAVLAQIKNNGLLELSAGADVTGGNILMSGGGDVRWALAKVAQSGTGISMTELATGHGGAIGTSFADAVQLLSLFGTGPFVTNLEHEVGATECRINSQYNFAIKLSGGTQWRFLNTGELVGVSGGGAGNPIQSVKDPVNAQDAATKNYVDLFASPQNFIINGAFDFWQRNFTSFTADVGASASTRVKAADRWWISSLRGAGGSGNSTLVQTRQTSALTNSKYMSRFTFTTIPSGATYTQAWAQEIDRDFVKQLRGKKVRAFYRWRDDGVSTSALIRVELISGTGAVTENAFTGYTGSVVQATADQNPPTTAGASSLATAAALPTNMTTLALRFSNDSTMASLWSSGGYVEMGEIMLVVDSGTAVPTYTYAGKTAQGELAVCKRYYEKSYEVDTTPGTASTFIGPHYSLTISAGGAIGATGIIPLAYHPRFSVEKWRTGGTVRLWTESAGTLGSWTFNVTAQTVFGTTDGSAAGASAVGFIMNATAGFTPPDAYAHGHWDCDAEI